MANPSSKQAPYAQKKKGCCTCNYHTSALLVTFMTLLNGGYSVIYGIETFVDGGSIVPDEAAVQTALGSIIVFCGVCMLAVLYSRMRESRFMVLTVGPPFAALPVIMLASLAIFLGVSRNSSSVQNDIFVACNTTITAPFDGASVDELREACFEDNLYYLSHDTFWAVVRTLFQVVLGSVAGLWTYWHVADLVHRKKDPENPFSDRHGIPLPERSSSMTKSDYEVYFEGGKYISKPKHVEIPRYEESANGGL